MTKEELANKSPKGCSKCSEVKSITEFYWRQKNQQWHAHSECKVCTLKAKREWDVKNKEYILQYARTRYFVDSSVKEKSKLRRRGLAHKRNAPDPFKNKARKLLEYAVRIGRVTRQPCEVCGSQDSNGHHTDYSKPYDVNWLCDLHHGEQHRKYEGPLVKPRRGKMLSL